MNNIPEKLCLFCKSFYFATGVPDYSEQTPGEDATILCMQDHWEIDLLRDTTETYRQKLLTAQMCEDWEQIEL